MRKDRIISFDKSFKSLNKIISDSDAEIMQTDQNMADTEKELEALQKELKNIPGYVQSLEKDSWYRAELTELDAMLEEFIKPNKTVKSALAEMDIYVAILAGTLATVIDIVFVGTPEVVKIYKGGENFDGSILTGVLRKAGNGNDKLSEVLKWLSKKCKVPYDISVCPGVVNPNNHRLRNFGHDPMFGLLFAVVDIFLGTTTFIDEKGVLRIVVNEREYSQSQKLWAVFYYLGHLLSDVCTARGLPIPGWITTQIFSGKGEKSIAKVAEMMYRDGYDLRHLASMNTAVAVKNMVIKGYLYFTNGEVHGGIENLVNKAIRKNEMEVQTYKLNIIADTVACSGNVLKFFLPPTCGNMTALNLSEWISLIKSTITVSRYNFADREVKLVVKQRNAIDTNWKKLQKES